MHRKIAVVTGSRAEYGLLYWLMKALKAEPTIAFQLIVTGMHLSPEFGFTCQDIMQDGFVIDEKVEMLLSSDTSTAITKSVGLGVIGFADAFARLQPDMVVVLGDRFEIFAAAQAALIAKIPTVHIHGGELTQGAFDDALRHSITKMSQLHFVASETYRKRVIQLGEHPDRVINVGPMVIETLQNIRYLSKPELEAVLDLRLQDTIFAVTFHPETLSNTTPRDQFGQLLIALDHFPNASLVFSKANADTDGRQINEMIDEYCAKYPERATGVLSLGHLKYLSLLSHATVVIGNSSSGIIEAPFFNIPTVNIGHRQQGRFHANTIINCNSDAFAIQSAIEKSMDKAFLLSLNACRAPHLSENGPKISNIIVETLKNIPLEGLIQKQFWDIAPDLNKPMES